MEVWPCSEMCQCKKQASFPPAQIVLVCAEHVNMVLNCVHLNPILAVKSGLDLTDPYRFVFYFVIQKCKD